MNRNRWVLITGCSSGIGLATALGLQQRGYDVIASCRSVDDIAKLKAQGLNQVIELDLTRDESIAQAVAQVLAITEGRLYALFNNAAYGLPGAVEDLPRDALRRQFETNVFGTHELTRRLLPTLLQQDDARIIQNSSVLGFVAMANRGAYIASKFALEGLTDTLRLELCGTAVKVCLIEPGPIASAFRANALAAFKREIDIDNSRHKSLYHQALQRLQQTQPSSRFTLPAEAVVKQVVAALEAKRPRARYRVTTPTHLMAVFKRVLPTRALDAFVRHFGSG